MKTKAYWHLYYIRRGGERWSEAGCVDTRDKALRKAASFYESGERWLLAPIELPDPGGGEDDGDLEFRPEGLDKDTWYPTFDEAEQHTRFPEVAIRARRRVAFTPPAPPAWEDITAEVRALAEGAS